MLLFSEVFRAVGILFDSCNSLSDNFRISSAKLIRSVTSGDLIIQVESEERLKCSKLFGGGAKVWLSKCANGVSEPGDEAKEPQGEGDIPARECEESDKCAPPEHTRCVVSKM